MVIPAGWQLQLVDEDGTVWSAIELVDYDLAQAPHRTGLMREIEVAVQRVLQIMHSEPPG